MIGIKDKFSVATEIMKINEEHEVELLACGTSLVFGGRTSCTLLLQQTFSGRGNNMEENKVVAYVRSSTKQGEAENDLNNRATT
ncbi:hypothetical protein Dsin_028803 [Dipteronia sinensis]|uniref:Uncharacterized protein n=1 Tax=Dipteronia sinensis TaxID=43782 RepID=A0AAD9ZRH1_9ROSI|nr:hypothetical protein Dsin_028803 [Dipteronia sinensis]